ncbi:MAG: ABC transporter ATP-binding protein [Chitinophagales bacterium]
MAEEVEKKKRIKWQDIKSAYSVFKFLKPYKWHFALGFLLLVIASGLFMTFPIIIGEMINKAEDRNHLIENFEPIEINGETYYPSATNANILSNEDLEEKLEVTQYSDTKPIVKKTYFDFTVNQYAIMLFGILILQGFFSFMRVNLFAIVSEKGMADLRKQLYQKLLTQRVEFFEKRRVGEITSRITADVEQLQSAFSFTFAELIRQIIILIVGLSYLIITQLKLSLVMLGVMPLIVIFAMIFGRYIKKLSKQRQDNLADTNVIVEETIQSFQAVKTFVNERFELKRYSASIDRMIEIALKFARIKGWFISFIIVFLFGAIMLVLWQGALMIQSGELLPGSLVTFVMLTMIIGGTIAGLGNNYTLIAGALGATERVKDILEQDSEFEIEGDESILPIQLNKSITYDQVSFHYPTREDVEVLKNISFTVKKGDKVALVGSSGSGKSTIVKLLSNLYDIQTGTISIDGNNIGETELKSLRKAIGNVPQEVILFGGSIKENILYGNPNATEEEIKSAAKQANALDFIEKFPEGMDTLVGERGIQLSGGEKQRIAIARAILKNPQILVLDEATSSLDAESEKLVQDALEKLMENRTTFIIAHRLSTVRNADTIFVVNDGKIVEQGNHEELTALNDGFYNNLLKLQFEGK